MKICKMIVRVIIVILFLFSALILYSLVEPNFSDYLASLLFQPKYQEEVPVKLVEVGAIEDEVEDQEQWSIEKKELAITEITNEKIVRSEEEIYFYFTMLSDQEQKVYQQICENVNALKSTFSLEEAITVKQLEQVLLAVYNDHPEFFWLDTNYKYEYNPSGVVLMVTLQFNETVDTIIDKKNLFEKRSQEIIESIQEESDEYKKELLLYNKLLNEITYDRDAENNQSAYSAIVNGRTVCAGYARAFQYLMCRMGIPTYYCTGITNENHAWNIVKLSDGYYNVDVTWDDSEQGRYLYFNKSDIDFSKDHQRKELSINLPSCSGEKYRYY